MKGMLECCCGHVKIEIGDAKPKMRLQCGCCDCRQAVQWAQLQGGPKEPTSRPLDLWYFGNDIIIASGKDKVKWYKLREDGKVLLLCRGRVYFKISFANYIYIYIINYSLIINSSF